MSKSTHQSGDSLAIREARGETDQQTETKEGPAVTDAETPLTRRLLNVLDYREDTAVRARDEEYEFRVVAPMLIEVANATYGDDERAAHTYTVTVMDKDGLFVPNFCTCPFYQYRGDERGACKHMVAAVAAGGPPLLGAAAVFTGEHRHDGVERDPTTGAELLAARDSR